MALIKCPECGTEISDKSKVCANCGYPLKAELKKEKEERELFQKEEREKDLLINNIKKLPVSRLYEIAHNCHYSQKDEKSAYAFYEMITISFPNTPECAYSKSQIDNLLKSNKSLHEISSSEKEEIIELYVGELINEVLNTDVSCSVIKRQLEQRKQLKESGIDGYYEYKVIPVMDKVGRTDIDQVSEILNQMGLDGWHLKSAMTNELGKNALMILGLGINSTADETVLIFERYIKI